MRRLLLAAFALTSLLGCPGILGIDEGVLTEPAKPGDLTSAPADPSTGAAGAGPAIACAAPLSACGDRCVDFAFDPNSCGACERRCAEGICSAGRCEGKTLVSPTTGAAERLEVDADGMYFTTSAGWVFRANLDGSNSRALSSDRAFEASPFGPLVMSDGELFWASNKLYGLPGNKIFRCGKTLPSPKVHADLGEVPPFALAFDLGAGELFFGDMPSSPSSMVGKLGGPSPQTVGQIAAKELRGMAVNASHVFATARDIGALVKWPRSGGTGELVASGFVAPERVVLDAQNAYVLDTGDASSKYRGSIVRVALSDGTKTVLAADLPTPLDLRVDGGFVYFTTNGSRKSTVRDGTVVRVAANGPSGAPLLMIAVDQAHPRALAIQGPFVYWTNDGEPTLHNATIVRSTK
jgi:hypothetical protein